MAPRSDPWPRRLKIGGGLIGIAVAVATALFVSSTRQPADPTRQPILRQLTFDTGLTSWPAVSWDGALLAYASDRADPGNMDIWIQHISGEGEPIQLTEDPFDDTEPAFSPDGSKIAFRSTREPAGIYVIPALGGEPTLLAERGWYPRFSPDGRWIVYQGRFGLQQVFLIPASGGEPRRLGADIGYLVSPLWSPDSTMILAAGSASQAVWWLVPIDGSPATRIPVGNVWSEAGFAPAVRITPDAWTPDGNQILFATDQGASRDAWRVTIDPRAGRIVGPAKRLTAGSGKAYTPRPSAPGQFVFADIRQSVDLWTLPIDHSTGAATGPIARLTRSAADDGYPSLSADGQRLLFTSERGGSSHFWLMDLATGHETAVPVGPDAAAIGGLSADGTLIAYAERGSRRRIDYTFVTMEIGRGTPALRFEGEGAPRSWRSKTDELLLQWWSPGPTHEWIAIHNLRTGVTSKVLELDTTNGFFHDPALSPDANWLVGHRGVGPDRRQVYLASTRRQEPIDIADAIAITDGSFSESKAVFSPDSNRLYYLSNRDGHFCIWTQRLSATDKQPAGEATAVHHMHDPGPSIDNLGPAVPGLKLATAPGRLVLPLGEQLGNIWLFDDQGEQ